jgi:DedD protein
MMEKALKERIIGAIVLVAVVVLVVPVFLDGPASDDKIVSEIVPLPGQSEQAVHTVVLDRDRDDPVPAQVEPAPATQQQAAVEASPPPQETTTTAPEREAEEDKPEPPATSTSVQSAGSTTGMWAVQLGSFSNQQNAEKLAADLRKQGFAAFLSQLSTSSGQLHRVRVGPQKDREAAEAMAARLQKAGHTGKTLPHP